MDRFKIETTSMKAHNLSPTLLHRLKENILGPGGLFYLDLSSTNIGPKELTVLGDVIKHNGLNCEGSAPLISIDFTNNLLCGVNNLGRGHYDSEGLSDFCTAMIALRNMSRLKKFDFSRNYLHTKGMNCISNMISNGFTSLTELILKDCQLSAESIERLCHILTTNRSLSLLDISENNFGNHGGQLISEVLQHNSRLKQLILNSCELQTDGAIPIFQSLMNNNGIEILYMNDNIFGDRACEMIGNMLKINTKLKFFDIQENCIGIDGITAIAKGLMKNHSLNVIGLQWNDLNNDCAMKIAEALGSNNTLNAIHILGNHIDVEGIKAIVLGSLNGNTKPIEIDLGHCYRPPGRGKLKAERKVIKQLSVENIVTDGGATIASNNTGSAAGSGVSSTKKNP